MAFVKTINTGSNTYDVGDVKWEELKGTTAAAKLGFEPTSGVPASTVQDAIAQLDARIAVLEG